jgi:hypothetical protein
MAAGKIPAGQKSATSAGCRLTGRRHWLKRRPNLLGRFVVTTNCAPGGTPPTTRSQCSRAVRLFATIHAVRVIWRDVGLDSQRRDA